MSNLADLDSNALLRDLTAGVVHLWYVGQDQIDDAAGVRAIAEGLLTPEERDRWQRLRRADSRREFLATRALVRQALALYADVPPSAWRFEVSEGGKPEIANPVSAGLRFNLSNTSGMVVCGVALGGEVGVDVENSERRASTRELAERYFSPREVDALEALPKALRRPAFFRYWTLKESYLKARGTGLSIPLDQFSFQLDRGSGIAVHFDPPLCSEDRSSDWSFWQEELSDRHVAAVALRRQGDSQTMPGMKVRSRQFSLQSGSPNFKTR